MCVWRYYLLQPMCNSDHIPEASLGVRCADRPPQLR
eukprot:COSAG01_NODE_54917_length_329_cov_0.386957_1_plen_35_part_01